jgi:flagellar basal body-associated protein FliL
MKGDAAMVQIILQVLIVGLLTAMAGIIWVIVRHSFDDDLYSDDNQQGGSPSSEPSNGKDPHKPSSRQSKIAA